MIKNFTNSFRKSAGIKLLALSAGLLLSLTATVPNVQAQVPYTENFEVAGPYPQLILPRSWYQGKFGASFSSINQFDIVATGTNPPAAPVSATTMLRFGSFNIPNGEASFIASKMLDMRAIPAGGANFSFRFHRDPDWATDPDRIEVYLNDSAIATPGNPSQTLLTENVTLATTIHRATTYGPLPATAGWNQFFYTVPGTPGVWNKPNVYVIIVAYSDFGNDMYIDNFVIDTYPAAQNLVTGQGTNSVAATTGNTTITVTSTHVHNFPVGSSFVSPAGLAGLTVTAVNGSVLTLSGPVTANIALNTTLTTSFFTQKLGVVNQNTSTTAPGQLNQQIIGIRITMDGALNPRLLQDMVFNTNGSTNPSTDIVAAKLYTTGATPTWSPANALLLGTVPNPWLTNYTFFASPATYVGLEHGDNYLWIAYDLAAGATPGNFVDAEWVQMKMNVGTANGNWTAATNTFTTQIDPQTLVGNRLIDVVYCQPSFTVGTAWAGYFTNDYINGVRLDGDNAVGSALGTLGGSAVNPRNRIFGPAGSRCAGGTLAAPILCAYQRHPPDYENFPEAGYAAAPSHPAVTQTTTILTSFVDRVSSLAYPTGYLQPGYPMSLQVGDYGSGNAIAAWIDFNGDGVFNNYFDNLKKLASGTSGTNLLNLANVSATLSTHRYYGLNVGMTVFGPGIPATGYTVTVVDQALNRVTLSGNLTATSSNATYEFVNITAPMDRGEKIAQSGPMGAWAILSAEFKAPAWASNFSGKRRLRVREVWINYNIDPCNTATYGETEDYTVTVRPSCPVYTGPDGPYKTWLGFTDNWNDPANWCPEGAPIFGAPLSSLRFPGGPTGGTYPYTKAKIASGTLARARKFRIEVGDTVNIDAPAASDLVVTDSLVIQTATSMLKVNTKSTDTLQLYNGVLYPTPVAPSSCLAENLIPLRVNNKTRSMWIYDRNEFLLNGNIDGDVIDTIRIHLQRRSNGNLYKNAKIKYFFSSTNTFSFNADNVVITPNNHLGAVITPIQVFSGNIDVSAIPVGGWGTVTIPLTGTGIVIYPQTSGRRLIVEMSYDQLGSGLTGTSCCAFTAACAPSTPQNEDMRYTQTGSQFWYITWSVNAYAGAADAMPNTLAASEYTLSGNVRLRSNLRPNLTFSIKRPYIKFPITLNGAAPSVHWVNNGSFTPADSRVFFQGTANQKIEGTATTTFHEVQIDNPAHVTMLADIIVQDTLELKNLSRLKLNNRMATLQNPLITGLQVTGGFLQSDNDIIGNNIAPYSRFQWLMGTATDTRIIPYVSANAQYLPLTYKPNTGTHNVTFTTYRTNPDNTNIPAPTVTNIFGFNGSAWSSDGTGLADRFYMVDNTLNPTSTANVTFSYWSNGGTAGNTERAASNLSGAATMRAQRWLNDSTKWEEFPFFHPTQTYTPGALRDEVTVTNFSGAPLASWWVITGQSTPLPVTLLDFVAVPFKDKVKLQWSTSAELNASHYVVERTTDNEEFSFIGQVAANGTTSSRTDYNTWDMNPVEGIQYYYLRQYDRDGKMETYGPVSAKFTSDVFDIVTATVSSSEMGLTVVFNYDNNEPVSYRVLDMTGRIVASKNRIAATPGLNVIDIDAKLAQGAYQISIMNSEKTVSRKFFY
jgi:hypothetical protein